MKTDYWLSYPSDYKKQLKPLLHQQIDDLVEKLDDCLLTDEEMARWQRGKLTLDNPFLALVEEPDEVYA